MSDKNSELEQRTAQLNVEFIEYLLTRIRDLERPRTVAAQTAHEEALQAALAAATERARELEAENKRLRDTLPKFSVGDRVQVGLSFPSIGEVEEIRITAFDTFYSVYVDDESMPYTWTQEDMRPVAAANGDAASAAAEGA